MNRLTQTLVALAALMVLAVGAAVLLMAFGNPFHRVTDSAMPIETSQAAARREMRLGLFSDLGGGLARAPLLVDWQGADSYRYKEVSGTTVNLLYSGPQGDRWLYPTNGQVLVAVDDIGPPDGPVTGTLIQLADSDRDGNGTLSAGDGLRLLLTAADGTAPRLVAEGLAAPATVSPGAGRWLVSWIADGTAHLAAIDPATGTLGGAPRRLPYPEFE